MCWGVGVRDGYCGWCGTFFVVDTDYGAPVRVWGVCLGFVVVWCPCWTENEYGGARTELPLT